MNENNYCVIMAGGIGSRFWPVSRRAKPKQFLDMLGIGKSFLQQTYERFNKICLSENIYIVTNSHYKSLVIEQLPQLNETQILLEPVGRNTAPCIAYATHSILTKNKKARIVVAPSDHLILHAEKFIQIANDSLEYVAKKDVLLTLGIRPNRPETGYGYIQIDELTEKENLPIYTVKTFTEKPNLEIAQVFFKSGEFFWNSGIFFWTINSILTALETFLPEVNALFAEGADNYGQKTEVEFIQKVYAQCPNISIDYGIMEKASNVDVYCADFGWSDLGTWGSLYEHTNRDENDNAVKANTLLYNTKNCIINSDSSRLIAIQGLEGYVVAESENALLICKIENEQKIRQIVNDAKLSKGSQYV